MVDDEPAPEPSFTTSSAARALGATREQIRALARDHHIGVLVPGRFYRMRRFTSAEVERMRALRTRPKKRLGVWRPIEPHQEL